MEDSKNVLYTGAFRFPDQDAAAFRVYSVAQLFQANGYTVVFAGWESHCNGVAHYVYRGHDCFPQGEFRNGQKTILKRLFGFIFRGYKTISWVWRFRYKFSIIVAYNPSVFFALILIIMGKVTGFKVVLDSTEWYESDHLMGGRYGLASLENWVRMHLIYKQFKHVICISSYLEKYFFGRNTVQIPPLTPSDISSVFSRADIKNGLNLIYAGEAGRKDRLSALIESLPKVKAAIHTAVRLHVVGMDWGELSSLLITHRFNPADFRSFVKCHGRISRDDVMALYGACHFSILFRENKRYAFAGFPTKAMESFANGCPLITNAVGDLANVAINRSNAIVLEESELSERLPVLMVEVISEGYYMSMTKESLETAKKYFSPSAHATRFAHFLRVVCGYPN